TTPMPTTPTPANALHHGSLRRKDPVACSTVTASAAFLDGLVCRAAIFFARTVRVGLSVFFVRTDTLLSVILCRALSAESRYRSDRRGGFSFFRGRGFPPRSG